MSAVLIKKRCNESSTSCWFGLSGHFNRILDAKVANSSFKNQARRRLMHQGPGGLQELIKKKAMAVGSNFVAVGLQISCKDCEKTTQALKDHTPNFAIIRASYSELEDQDDPLSKIPSNKVAVQASNH